jgi:DNA invertase Pin-like site-specific DNA recombinase
VASGKFVSYIRVSTQKQGESGLGLEAQQAAVKQYLKGGDWQLVREVIEIESGKRSDRPKLAEALKLCKRHKATLIIAKLDRLARNVAFISNLMESGVEFVAVDMPAANKFVIHVLAAVAEHEAEAISRRTKDALAAARARGVKLGGRRVPPERFEEISKLGRKAAAVALRKQREAREHDIKPIVDEITASGIKTLRGIANELNARGEPTPRNRQWSAVQVMRILNNTKASSHRDSTDGRVVSLMHREQRI